MPSLDVFCFQGTERFGASFRHRRVNRAAARHDCPAAFLDKHVPIPSVTEFVQLAEICGCVGRLTELVDADRCKSSNDRGVGPLLCDLFNGASERPSAPVEANDYRHDGASDCALQQTFEGVSLQK